MRIYNGKNSQLDLPLNDGNGERLSIGPKSISKDFLPSTSFLSMVTSTFDYSEIALIVSGIIEVNMCSSVPCCNGFVVYSVSEAVDRFSEDNVKLNDNEKKNPGNLTAENLEKHSKEIKEAEKKEEDKKKSQKPASSENQ